MGIANGIRKHGFRTWHERALLGSHGWLILTLFCAIAVLAALESMINSTELSDRAINAAAILISGPIGLISLRRFLYQMVRVQTAASQATCPKCATFGRLSVVTEDRAASWVRVRCRKCEHEWAMDG